jgi:ABC-2 type transport system permease protein
MRALLVARKSLLEMVREPQLLGLVLLIPLIFLVITVLSYNAPLLATHPVWVINVDPSATALLEALESQRYANGQSTFDVTMATMADRPAAEEALKERAVTALVIIVPPDSEGQARSVTILGDALYMRFYRASTILNSVVQQVADREAGWPGIVHVVEEPLGAASPQTEFDLYAPGIMIFALLMIIPQTAMLVAREVRWGTLRRLRLTRLRAWDLLAGIGLAQMVVAVIQVVVMFVGALAMGFRNQGSLLLAIVVGLVVSFSAIGMGLIVACFAKNDSQAANAASTVAMIQVFLSGSFYQLPSLTMFTLAGHQIDLFDVFPATHGFLALQQVLSYGAGLQEVGFRLGATVVLSAFYFVVGVLVFQRWQMRAKES